MPTIITLTDLVINQIYLDYINNKVIVLYSLIDGNGKSWQNSEATFWATMPPQTPIYSGSSIIGYEPYPDSWFELPATYLPTLVGLQTDADAALTARFLV